jgi:hypothetical protein
MSCADSGAIDLKINGRCSVPVRYKLKKTNLGPRLRIERLRSAYPFTALVLQKNPYGFRD